MAFLENELVHLEQKLNSPHGEALMNQLLDKQREQARQREREFRRATGIDIGSEHDDYRA